MMNRFWVLLRPLFSIPDAWCLSRILKLLTLGLGAALLVVACSPSDSQISDRATANLNGTNCRMVEHDVGETQVCGQPKQIVALGPHILDLLLSLDMQPAGYAEVFPFHGGDSFNNPSAQIPYLGNRVTTQPVNLGDRSNPSLESLTRLQPDLILGEAGGLRQNYDMLSKIAPTLLWEKRTAKGKWQENLRQLAAAIGQEDRAEAVIAEYNQQIAAARDQLAPVVAKYPQVLLLGANQLVDIRVVNDSSYLGEVLEGVGFELVSPPAQNKSELTTAISLETLPQLNDADLIFILGYETSVRDQQQKATNAVLNRVIDQQTAAIQQEWQNNAIAQSLKASQEDRVFFVTYYLWNGLNGPLGAQLILDELRQLLLSSG